MWRGLVHEDVALRLNELLTEMLTTELVAVRGCFDGRVSRIFTLLAFSLWQ